MATILLSEAEKTFILHGVEENFRCDGRSGGDYRPMELETEVVTHANGSTRLRLANTDVLVGIKAEIDVPDVGHPDRGKLEFFVDCSANAAPEFEGRGGEELAFEISDTLVHSYYSELAFDKKTLCIIPGRQCWKLYIDILILECGGNLFDAVSLAVKAALYNTRIPRITTAILDGGSADLVLSDDPHDCDRIDIQHIPIVVTVCKIGNSSVVDPSAEEEECSIASVVVAVSRRDNENYITHVHTRGMGSFHENTLDDCIERGLKAAECLDTELVKALQLEDERIETIGKREIFGFLR